MTFHQVFIRKNRLILSNGTNEISYTLEEIDSLIEAIQEMYTKLEANSKIISDQILPLQEELQKAQKRWDSVGSDEHLRTALELALEGNWEVGLQSLTLIFGEQAAFDAISRCWKLDDLGWASQIEGLPKKLLCGSLGMTACAPADHPLQNLWSVGSFDDILLDSLEYISISHIPSSVYTRLLHLLTQEIYLPPTTFKMGQEGTDAWSFEGPIHDVVLQRPIYAMIFPVTQILYANPFEKEVSTHIKDPSFFSGATRPVECVSWLDAIQFCNLLSQQQNLQPCYEINDTDVMWNKEANGYRLPTESEWECLARGNQNLKYAGSDTPRDTAWFSENSEDRTHCVGKKRPNNFGLYDMCGNVWEWCWDGYASAYEEKTQVDPIGTDSTKKVLRGGGFESAQESIRITMRGRFEKEYTWKCLGLRLVRNG